MTYYSEPTEVTGYALDTDDSFWEVCIPHATRNLVADPSFEGFSVPNIGSVITTDAMLGISCASSALSAGTQRVRIPFTTEVAGTHTVSAHVKLNASQASRPFNIQIRDSLGAVLSTKQITVAGTGKWIRIVLVSSQPLLATTSYFIEVNCSIQFVADCFQAEALPYATTYVDGDLGIYMPDAMNSYYWDGLQQNSTSVRLDNTRTGGKLVSLADYGFRTLGISGLGHVPIQREVERTTSGRNRPSSFSVTERPITITGNIYGNTFEEINKKRRKIIDLFSPLKLGELDDPILLRVRLNETEIPLDLMVRYADGLESEITNRHQQSLQIRLTAIENPYLSGNYNSKQFPALAQRNNVQAMVKNLETGEWTPYNYQVDMSASTGAYRGRINDLFLAPNGDLYACGSMTFLVHKLKVAADGENFSTPSFTYVGRFSSANNQSRLTFSSLAQTSLIASMDAVTNKMRVAQQKFIDGDLVYITGASTWETMEVIDNGISVSGGFEYTVNRNLDGGGADSWASGSNVQSNNGAEMMDATYILGELYIAVAGKLRVRTDGADYTCSVAVWRSSTNTWTGLLLADNSDPFVNGSVYSIAFFRNNLYIGGKFAFAISTTTYRALAGYEIINNTWFRPITFTNNNDEVNSLYVHSDMKLYIFGEWTLQNTGSSNRLISQSLGNLEIVSVLPSLVSASSGGPLYPTNVTQILFDNNNKINLLENLGQGAHALFSPGKEAPSLAAGLIVESGYSDWSYNYFAVQGISGTSQAISFMAKDANNNIYLSGPILNTDLVLQPNFPSFRNNLISRVWNRSGALSETPLDAYHQSTSLARRMYYPIQANHKSIAVASNMEGSNLYYAVPIEVVNDGSVPVQATLQISARCRFAGFWNWTTQEQLVLKEPISLINSGQRIVVFQKDNQFVYSYVLEAAVASSVTNAAPIPVPINPSGTTSNALMLRPGKNYVTLFFGKVSDAVNPSNNPQIVWRNQHGYM